MKIEIVTEHSESRSMVREYVQRKVDFALGRLDAPIGKVVARLHEPDACSPVFAGVCTIEIELIPEGHIHVSADGESPFDCVLQAIHKMELAVKQEMDRSQQSTRRRHQQANGTPHERGDRNGQCST